MKPHELVNKLVEGMGGELQVARLMGDVNFQGTLYKFCKGDTTSPTRATAERIAKFFKIPVDAMYDAKIATEVAQRRLKNGQFTPSEEEREELASSPEARDALELRLLTAFRQVIAADRQRFVDLIEARAEELLAIAAEMSGSTTRLSRRPRKRPEDKRQLPDAA